MLINILNNLVNTLKPKSYILCINNEMSIMEYLKTLSDKEIRIYNLSQIKRKNTKNVTFIDDKRIIKDMKFDLILHVSENVNYYQNNYLNLRSFKKFLFDEGHFLSLINSNINSSKFNEMFFDNYYFVDIFPKNSLLSVIHFKKIPKYIKIDIKLTNIPNNQQWLVKKIHNWCVSTKNFKTISSRDVLHENIHISEEDIIRGTNIAILNVPENINEYLKLIGSKSRNMIKKCEKNEYYGKKINPDEYLDDIFKINTSKKFRQGKEMTESYKKFPKKYNLDYESFNSKYCVEFYGIFKNNTLVAYGFFYFCNEFVMLNSILGHGDHLTYGIMNLLTYFIVNDIIENHKSAKYINYLTISDSSKGKFKLNIGYEKYKYLIVNKTLM